MWKIGKKRKLGKKGIKEKKELKIENSGEKSLKNVKKDEKNVDHTIKQYKNKCV